MLIDTGDGRDAYIPVLQDAMKASGTTDIAAVVLTHWHLDHIGGIPSVVDLAKGAASVHKYMIQGLCHITLFVCMYLCVFVHSHKFYVKATLSMVKILLLSYM